VAAALADEVAGSFLWAPDSGKMEIQVAIGCNIPSIIVHATISYSFYLTGR
jgi:hypothetical protein